MFVSPTIKILNDLPDPVSLVYPDVPKEFGPPMILETSDSLGKRSGFRPFVRFGPFPSCLFLGYASVFYPKYLAFGKHLEEIHVTWAHLEKKQTRLQTNTKTLQDLKSQRLETTSPFIHDAVTLHLVTASQHFLTASARTDSTWIQKILLYDGDENHIRTLGDYSKPSHEGYRNTIELPVGNNVSLDLDGENRERTRLRLFQFSFRDQASNWLERLPAGSITTWEDLTPRESLSEAWTRFKDLLRKVPHHGIDLWLQVQIFYDRIDHTLKRTVEYAAVGRLRKLSAEKAWATIEELTRYEDEGWNYLVAPGEGSLDYENPDIE
ncbi:hypothetical protein Tco_0846706 [Tanacetum coccineum]